MGDLEVDSIHRDILEKYLRVAISPQGLFHYPTGEASALGLGYPPELVDAVPPSVRERFVGVGNPFALGAIRTGEAVLDLGCGAGFDVFIAARYAGPTGRAVGVDLSPEMVAVAESARALSGVSNVEFHQAAVEALPFAEGAFDVALSNGVLNLVPDKPMALRELLRVLTPGGRLQACDMGLVGDAPPPDKAPWSD
jgi:arsenite methyltransferase